MINNSRILWQFMQSWKSGKSVHAQISQYISAVLLAGVIYGQC